MAVSPFAWRPCCLRTIQRPLAASPCGRLSRPRSTISQSDCRRAFGPFSPFRLGGSYKLSLEPDSSPLFTRNLWTACRRYEPRQDSVRGDGGNWEPVGGGHREGAIRWNCEAHQPASYRRMLVMA